MKWTDPVNSSEIQTIEDVHKNTQRNETNSRYQDREISHNVARLVQEVRHTNMQKSYSPNFPDLQSDQETGRTYIDMVKTYTYINEAEIHHQIGGSQEIRRTSDVTSIRVEISDKVQIQTSTGNKKEESSKPNDKLINDKEVESSYQGKKALHTNSIREPEIHHELGSSYTNANKTSSSRDVIEDINKTELSESI